MYYEDLSEYVYGRPDEEGPALNIGWLDSCESYPTGDVPPGFVDKLRLIMKNPSRQWRGFHICPFCNDEDVAYDNPDLFKICHEDGRLCSREIRVVGLDGTRYASPSMIAHYVEVHNYCPPDEFIAAVMKT